ncbi:acetate--CoA ligase family protein [Dactylosporangium sp. CA-233914]|uniref:acetate--CoA ligase family protein n=1 Tax=Dactylosporangium sp. CA-233914 TaxID=3239934 RepID=UPI003D9337FC
MESATGSWQDAFLNMKSIVFVGATNDQRKQGYVVLDHIKHGGFSGPVYGVNPKRPVVFGERTYASALDLPEVPDLAFIATAPAAVPDALRDVGRAGIPLALVHTSGFAEVGGNGVALHEQMLQVARQYGVRIIGPNSAGVFRAGHMNLLAKHDIPSGPIGLLTQAGSVITALADQAEHAHAGFSIVIAYENQADLGLDEFVDLLIEDEATKVIAIYAEGILAGRGEVTYAALLRAAAAKPTIVLKGGTTEGGMRAVASHTAAITSSKDRFEALVRSSGAVSVDSMEDMLTMANVLAMCPPLKTRAIAAVGTGGGLGTLLADALCRQDLTVPAFTPGTVREVASVHTIPYGASGNPVDLVGGQHVEARLHSKVNAIVRRLEPSIGGYLNYGFYGRYEENNHETKDASGRSLLEFARGLVEFAKAERVPVLFYSPFAMDDTEELRILRDGGIPTFHSIPLAAKSMRALADAYEGKQRATERLRQLDELFHNSLELGVADPKGGLVPDHKALAALDSIGVPVANWAFVSVGDLSRAGAVSESVGYPQVVKVVVDGLAHKSDVGGVRTGVSSQSQAVTTVNELTELFRSQHSSKSLTGFLIMSQVPADHELRIGIVKDESLGLIVDVGFGGTATELVQDHVSDIAPLSSHEAEELIQQLRMFPLLNGYRGGAVYDTKAIAELISKLTIAACSDSRLMELEVNPLRISPHGINIVDVKLRRSVVEDT